MTHHILIAKWLSWKTTRILFFVFMQQKTFIVEWNWGKRLFWWFYEMIANKYFYKSLQIMRELKKIIASFVKNIFLQCFRYDYGDKECKLWWRKNVCYLIVLKYFKLSWTKYKFNQYLFLGLQFNHKWNIFSFNWEENLYWT